MQPSSKWSVQSIEAPEDIQIPQMLLWKKALIFGFLGIGVGLGAGYLWRESRAATDPTDPSHSSRPPVVRIRFLPIPDAEPGEMKAAGREEALPRMPQASDSPFAEEAPPPGQIRPALIRLEDKSSRQSDKG